jgi:hypothetical protein
MLGQDDKYVSRLQQLTHQQDLELLVKDHQRIFSKVVEEHPGKNYIDYIDITECRLINYYKAYGVNKK